MKRFFAVSLFAILVTAAYAWLVEPFWIDVTTHHVAAGLANPVKMMVLSDLHTRSFGRLERAVLHAVQETRPDLIVVTGDCFTPRADQEAARRLLGSLKAPLGVWMVRGNWEIWNPVADEQAFFGLGQDARVIADHPEIEISGFHVR